MPPAVKLPAASCARSTLDPDIIAAEIIEDLQAALAQFIEIASHSENAVHTAHSQLCSPKAHRAQDQLGSATPIQTGVRIRVLPRRIGMTNGSDYDIIIIGSGAGVG